MKAYGRLMKIDEALALLPWLEEVVGETADVFFMRLGRHSSIVLYAFTFLNSLCMYVYLANFLLPCKCMYVCIVRYCMYAPRQSG